MLSKYIECLQKKPDYAQYKDFLWADYIELLCLANLDGEISKSDILDRLAEREDDLKEGDFDDIEEMDELNKEGLATPAQRYKRSDYWTTRISSWFEVIKSREKRYADNYPFQLDENDLVLKYESTNINHKYYIFLNACSNLKLFDKTLSTKLSSYYELLSYAGLKQVLPTTFSVELFGTNEMNNNHLFGTGITCLDKIKNLANSLNENLSSSFNEAVYPPNNFGDEGLDIVAFLKTGDMQPSNIIIFGQCACTEQWVNKQSTSSFESWSNKIDLTTTSLNAVFIPFCYRNATGDWFDRGKIRKSFVVDRFRLINFVKEAHPLTFDINPILDAILAAKEPII